MKKHTLSAQKRDLVGRKVKTLRKTGFIPATVYGKKVKSISVTVKEEDFPGASKTPERQDLLNWP